MATNPIEETLEALEAVVEAAGVPVATFSPNQRGDHAQVYWTGTDGQRLVFAVDVIPTDWRTVGDLFVTVWNALADSETFGATGFDVLYDAVPLGSADRAKSFVQIDVGSSRNIDIRGI